MTSKSTHTTMQTIKMVARNPITRRFEEVFPKSEVTRGEMIPLFWSECLGWVSMPDADKAEAYNEWIEQMG